jgi:hypothetical protein
MKLQHFERNAAHRHTLCLLIWLSTQHAVGGGTARRFESLDDERGRGAQCGDEQSEGDGDAHVPFILYAIKYTTRFYYTIHNFITYPRASINGGGVG